MAILKYLSGTLFRHGTNERDVTSFRLTNFLCSLSDIMEKLGRHSSAALSQQKKASTHCLVHMAELGAVKVASFICQCKFKSNGQDREHDS